MEEELSLIILEDGSLLVSNDSPDLAFAILGEDAGEGLSSFLFNGEPEILFGEQSLCG
jgi:hypothetical protein